MADIFVEYMVRRKPDTQTYLKRLSLWLTIILVILVTLSSTMLLLGLAFVILPCGFLGVWGLLILLKHLNIEYEYILTNSELDIDVIRGRSKRKRQLSVDSRNFDIFAPYKPEYAREYESQAIKKTLDFTSGNAPDKRYFAIFNAKDGARTLLIFEPSDRMRDTFKTYLRNKYREA